MSNITKEMALDYHRYPRPGKTEVIPTKPYSSQQDLALAYSPGVAYPCKEIEKNDDDVYAYTNKGNLVAVISNCTAVLGLGDIGAKAGKPVMEGKALLFKIFAGLDCFDIEVDEKDPEKFIQIVKALAPTFGGINLEDIKAPECFMIEERLKAECDIPIMHDDQHGTAIISGAGLLNALEIQKKNISEVRLVVNGAGAAATACASLYVALGVKRENVVMCDSKGVIRADRTDLNPRKREFATTRDIHTLADAMVNADVFLGLSVKGVLKPEMIKSMAERPIVFALANPDPEIDYETAVATRPDLIFATGRSDYPNQINNVLGFPYIFRGALDTRATSINEPMKLAAVRAIAQLAKEPVPQIVHNAYGSSDMSYGHGYILPKPLDPRLLMTVAPAVARAAMESGVARRQITDWQEYDNQLRSAMGFDNKLTRSLIEEAKQQKKRRVVFGEGNTDRMLEAAVDVMRQGIATPVLLGNAEMITKRAQKLNLDISDIEIVNPRHDNQADTRQRYARILSDRRQRRGLTKEEAVEWMFDRNCFGMMMVENGDADAFIAGAYSNSHRLQAMAADIVGIRDGYNHFATIQILDTKRGTLFLADTSTNESTDADTLYDITRLAADAARFFSHEPVMAMVSYSNFGTSDAPECRNAHEVVERMHREFPDLAIDGEMQVNYALDRELRDSAFPFTRLKDKNVNTLIFPNLSAANTAYRLMLEMGVGEAIGPIQTGLRKPIHFIKTDAPVRDIVNLATIAVLDAAVQENIDAASSADNN